MARPRTLDGEILVWLADCYESDGYASEALELIAYLRPARRAFLTCSPPASSPPEKTDKPAANNPEVWVCEDWPGDVSLIREQ